MITTRCAAKHQSPQQPAIDRLRHLAAATNLVDAHRSWRFDRREPIQGVVAGRMLLSLRGMRAN